MALSKIVADSVGTNAVTTAALSDSGVTAGSYGNTTAIPVITVDAKGRITSATTNSVSGVTGVSFTSANNTVTVSTSTTDFSANINASLNTTYSNATSYADTKAATAYSNATSYADTKAATAYSNGVTYSGTIAATAYSNAVSTASADASTKAATAYTNAVAYAAANSYVNSTFAPKAGPTFTGTAAFADVTISGNLTTSGTTTYINTTSLNVGDNIVTLNADLGATAPTENAGLEINRGTSANVALRWNESTDNWETTTDGTTYLTVATNTDVSTAYSNAVAYAAANSYVNTQLGLKANLSGATFSGAVSGITTLAAGNTTITGFANVSSTLQVNGNISQVWSNFRIGTFFDNSYRQGWAYDTSSRQLNIFSTTNDSGGVIAFNTRVGAGASDTDYGTTRMVIVANGNIGIANAAPIHLLSVNGTGYFGGNLTTPGVNVGNTSVYSTVNMDGGNNLAFNGWNAITLNVAGVNKAVVYPANTTFGTNTYINSTLTVSGNTTANVFYVDNSLADVTPSLLMDFVNGKTIDPKMTFQRASQATVINARGKLQVVGAGVPRFDHDILTGVCKGLLMEEQRTNYVLYSDCQTSTSIGSNSTDLGAVTGPDGSTGTARRIRFNAPSNSWLSVNYSVPASGTYVFSIWVRLNAGTAPSSRNGYFNAAGLSVQMNATPTSAWQRVYGTCTFSGSSTGTMSLPYYDAPTGTELDYAWAQLELGSFPTSLIPTTGSAATRSVDLLYSQSSQFTSFWNPIEGTIYSEARQVYNPGGASYPGHYNISNGSVNYRFTIGTRPNDLNLFVSSLYNGTSFLNNDGGFGASDRSIQAYPDVRNGSANAYVMSQGGSVVRSSISAHPGANVTQMFLGLADGRLNGHLKKFAYYPKYLSESQSLEIIT